MAAPDSSGNAGETLYEGLLDVVMTGVAIIVPLVVTLYLIEAGLNFVHSALQPFIKVLRWLGVIQAFRRVELIALLIDLGIYAQIIDFLTEIIAVAILFGGVLLVGFVGHNRYGKAFIDYVDLAIASIPGIGTVYKSFRRMGDVMLDEGAENFKEVKLVECLDDDMYVIGFETSSSPETVEDSTGHDEMVTLFLPMAPNPVTGGFLTHVPASKVYDVDMTIEEGVRSILTSGIATGERPGEKTPISMGDLDQLTDIDLQETITSESSSDDRTRE